MLFYALFYRCLCRGDSGNREYSIDSGYSSYRSYGGEGGRSEMSMWVQGRRYDGVLLSGWLNVYPGGEMVSDGFVCMMRTKRDVLLEGSETFLGSMMSERWDFRWEAGDNSVKLDAGIKGWWYMSSCVRWQCIGGVVCGVASRKWVPILSKAGGKISIGFSGVVRIQKRRGL